LFPYFQLYRNIKQEVKRYARAAFVRAREIRDQEVRDLRRGRVTRAGSVMMTARRRCVVPRAAMQAATC